MSNIPEEVQEKIVKEGERLYADDNVRQMVHINGGSFGYSLSSKRIEELEEALRKITAMKKLETETTYDYAFNRCWRIATEALNNNQSAKAD